MELGLTSTPEGNGETSNGRQHELLPGVYTPCPAPGNQPSRDREFKEEST